MSGELAKALAAFQGEAPKVAKDKTAKVPTKSGGSYSYSYADLADIAAAAYPLLSKHGLSFTCLPEVDPPRMTLRGVLLHISGERIEGVLPLTGSTPQEIGSSLTYARRYMLGCLTGIVTDADDDGALASKPRAQQRREAPRESEAWPETTPPADEPITDKTRAQLYALMGERHVSKPEDQRAAMGKVLGRVVESRSTLTEVEGRKLIASLRGQG
ncbi:MAG TPA: ERF family protein [Piscinibacter sp.]|nr:ERF family protein [Piscinibacter sp.]HPV80519.1 ERF family protein [Dermatophilaceae bacterium]